MAVSEADTIVLAQWITQEAQLMEKTGLLATLNILYLLKIK